MKNENHKKMNKNTGKLAITLFTLMMATMAMGLSASATPAGADTSAMDSMLDVAFWVVRILIGAIGGIPAFIKIVQGQADEDPRTRNSGIVALVITAVLIGAISIVRTTFFG